MYLLPTVPGFIAKSPLQRFIHIRQTNYPQHNCRNAVEASMWWHGYWMIGRLVDSSALIYSRLLSTTGRFSLRLRRQLLMESYHFRAHNQFGLFGGWGYLQIAVRVVATGSEWRGQKRAQDIVLRKPRRDAGLLERSGHPRCYQFLTFELISEAMRNMQVWGERKFQISTFFVTEYFAEYFAGDFQINTWRASLNRGPNTNKSDWRCHWSSSLPNIWKYRDKACIRIRFP